jgi:hypothetical protein
MRRASEIPFWLIVVSTLVVLAACYFFYRGAMTFLTTGGDIAAPITTRTVAAALNLTDTAVPTVQIMTATPQRPCLDFRIDVVKARVRECPKDTCDTTTILNQYVIICVYGDAPNAPDWYEVNLAPEDPIPHIVYVHKSVVKPVHPTPHPSMTATSLPTVTQIPVNFSATSAATP